MRAFVRAYIVRVLLCLCLPVNLCLSVCLSVCLLPRVDAALHSSFVHLPSRTRTHTRTCVVHLPSHTQTLSLTHTLTHIHTYTHAHTITTTTTTTTTWVSLSVKEPYAQPHLDDLTWRLGLTTTTSAALQERTEFRGTPLRLKSDMIGRTDNDCLYLTAYQHITVHAAARTSLQLEGRDCGSLCLLIIGCRSTAQAFQ